MAHFTEKMEGALLKVLLQKGLCPLLDQGFADGGTHWLLQAQKRGTETEGRTQK